MKNTVEIFFQNNPPWIEELKELRNLFLQSELKEELKWGYPCYTINGKNVALIHGFKNYFAILFFKGALLNDKDKLLIQQTQNVNAARHLRFSTKNEIKKYKKNISQFIKEAIANEKAGLKVLPKKMSDYPIVEVFEKSLDKNQDLRKAFYSLTPGRQRAYLLYFASAKQSTS